MKSELEKLLYRLENDYKYHSPNPEQVAFYTSFREDAHALAKRIAEETPPSREQSLALTTLEQVVMYANAAVARHS